MTMMDRSTFFEFSGGAQLRMCVGADNRMAFEFVLVAYSLVAEKTDSLTKDDVLAMCRRCLDMISENADQQATCISWLEQIRPEALVTA